MYSSEDRATTDDLVTTSEVAKLADTTVVTVNRWAKAGHLPVAMKLPGRNGAQLYRRSDVDAFLVARSSAGAA